MVFVSRKKTQKPPASAARKQPAGAQRKASVAKRGTLQLDIPKPANTAPEPEDNKTVIDREWFEAQLRQSGRRKWAVVAREIGMEKSMVSRSLKGERAFTVRDIVGLASMFNTTPTEICKRIGYPIEKRGVPLVGTVRDDGKVSLVTAKKNEVFETVSPPPNASAIVGSMQSSDLQAYNGATFVFAPSEQPLAAFGQLCVVEAEGHLTPYLGTIVKGKDRNRVALELFGGKERIELEGVHLVSPVITIQFA